MAISFLETVKKFNPYHGKDGRFTTAPTGGGFVTFSANPKTKAGKLAIERETERQKENSKGFSSSYKDQLAKEKEKALSEAGYINKNIYGGILNGRDYVSDRFHAQYMSHDNKAVLNNYFKALEANGDPTPKKPTIDKQAIQIEDDVKTGKYGKWVDGADNETTWENARKKYMKDYTGMEDADIETSYKALNAFFTTDSVSKDQTRDIDRYIEKAPVFDGTIYRGMTFDK